MPLSWTIDHDIRTIVATATGTLSREDLDTYLATVVGQGAAGYRAIFDASRAGLDLRSGDLVALSQVVRSRKPEGFDGALALIVTSEAERELATYFVGRTAESRLCRMFRNVAEARVWYAELDASARR
jgi:hypothetical protein